MPDDQPLIMFNALWFKPDGGWESYKQYLRLTGPILARHGGRLVSGGFPRQAVIGEFDADLIFLVEYPSWQAFQEFTSDPEYREVMHYRQEAITKSLLIRCDKLG